MEYTEQLLTQMDEALEDQSFVDELARAADAAGIKASFQARGIEIDDAAAEAAFDKMSRVLGGEELSVEDLELVAGGCRGCVAFCTLAGAALGAVGGPGGMLVGAAVGFTIGCIVGTRHNRSRRR